MISIKNPLFQKIFYPVFYILFTAALTLSVCFIIQKNVFTVIYVSGTSMKPTLMGDTSLGRVNYGVADTTVYTRTHLKRFDVVVTYYPASWGTGDSLKVKRVWGFPGETLTLSSNDSGSTFTVTNGSYKEIYHAPKISNKVFTFEKYNEQNEIVNYQEPLNVYEFNAGEKTFDTIASARNCTITLKADEYFLMGDNWSSSTDSYERRTYADKINLALIQGRVLYIEGTCRLEGKDLVDRRLYNKRYNF